MAIDNELVLSDKQAVTTSVNSTRAYDAGPQAIVAGVGEPIMFDVRVVGEDFAGLTGLTVQVVGSNNANLSSRTVIQQSDELSVGDLEAGERIFAGTLGIIDQKFRYYGFRYEVGGTATAGEITAYFGQGLPANTFYNKGSSMESIPDA